MNEFYISINKRSTKRMAETLYELIRKSSDERWSIDECYELMAQMFGYKDWEHLLSKINEKSNEKVRDK